MLYSATFRDTVLLNRKNVLKTAGFITDPDIDYAPARILALFEQTAPTVDIVPTNGGAAQPTKIWKQSVLEIWKKDQTATTASPFNPTEAEKVILTQMKALMALDKDQEQSSLVVFPAQHALQPRSPGAYGCPKGCSCDACKGPRDLHGHSAVEAPYLGPKLSSPQTGAERNARALLWL